VRPNQNSVEHIPLLQEHETLAFRRSVFRTFRSPLT
jgi:hypothetical protein